MKKEFSIYQTDIFKLKLLSNWAVELKGSIYSFYDPLGRGVLQISTYSTNKEDLQIDLKKEMKRFAKDSKVEKFKEIVRGRARHAIGEIRRNNYLTIIRIVQKNKNIALLTYNIKMGSVQTEEIDLVMSILNSFEFRDAKNGGKSPKKR